MVYESEQQPFDYNVEHRGFIEAIYSFFVHVDGVKTGRLTTKSNQSGFQRFSRNPSWHSMSL